MGYQFYSSDSNLARKSTASPRQPSLWKSFHPPSPTSVELLSSLIDGSFWPAAILAASSAARSVLVDISAVEPADN